MLDFGKSLMVMRAMINPDDGNRPSGSDPQLMEMVKGLQAQITAMQDEKQRTEYQRVFDDIKETFGDRLTSIEETLKAPAAGQDDPIEKAAVAMEEGLAKTNRLRGQLGMPPITIAPPEAPAKLTPQEMADELQKHGFEVKGPMGPKEMKEYFDKTVEEVEKKTEERMKKQFKSDEKRNAMLFDLASSFLENALPVLGNTGAKKGLAVAGQALKAAGAMATNEELPSLDAGPQF
jgi:hypothetical protein